MSICIFFVNTVIRLLNQIFFFFNQVVQLQELFEVRHSVFIIGNAGTGKTCVWKSLFRANQNLKMKPVAVDLNPKAVTNDELFGIINPATREWKDGMIELYCKTCIKKNWKIIGIAY